MSRQVRRRITFLIEKSKGRPGPRKTPLIPAVAKGGRMNSHVLWTRMRGRTEVYMHATKGVRRRYLGDRA